MRNREFQRLMYGQAQVIDCLMQHHKLETDTVADLIRKHGDCMREGVLLCLPADLIANELASYVSK